MYSVPAVLVDYLSGCLGSPTVLYYTILYYTLLRPPTPRHLSIKQGGPSQPFRGGCSTNKAPVRGALERWRVPVRGMGGDTSSLTPWLMGGLKHF